METNEIIGIAVPVSLTIVVGIIFYMENRVRHYKNYLRYRMYSIDTRDVKSNTSKIDVTDTGLNTGLNNSNIFDKNIKENIEIMQDTLNKYKVQLDNLVKLNNESNEIIKKQNDLIKALKDANIAIALKNSEIFQKEFKFPKRKIVCLCGSTKFKEAFEKANRKETAKGNIVLTVAMFGHLEGLDMDSEEKKTFDAVHYDKIELADEILVLNIDGYIGESTKKEIEYAKSLNKEIRYLEKIN